MTETGKNKAGANSAALELLNEVLRIEYSIVIHYPRLMNMVQDEQLKKHIAVLGNDSVGHADEVASIIRKLGGTPKWAFEAPPEGVSLKSVFETQLGKEKIAEKAHKKLGDMMSDPAMRAKFYEMSADEKRHADLAEKILAELK